MEVRGCGSRWVWWANGLQELEGAWNDLRLCCFQVTAPTPKCVKCKREDGLQRMEVAQRRSGLQARLSRGRSHYQPQLPLSSSLSSLHLLHCFLLYSPGHMGGYHSHARALNSSLLHLRLDRTPLSQCFSSREGTLIGSLVSCKPWTNQGLGPVEAWPVPCWRDHSGSGQNVWQIARWLLELLPRNDTGSFHSHFFGQHMVIPYFKKSDEMQSHNKTRGGKPYRFGITLMSSTIGFW